VRGVTKHAKPARCERAFGFAAATLLDAVSTTNVRAPAKSTSGAAGFSADSQIRW
jgi:hypothetical protein